ncbi:MAG: S-layer homology domain-containing protein, partial [Clostridia bacterium]
MKRITFLVLILLIISAARPVLAAGNTDIYIEPNSTNIEVGRHYTLDFFIANDSNLRALDITISFEGSSLEIIDANNTSPTSLTINQQINPLVLLNTIDYSTNTIRLALTWTSADNGETIPIAQLPFYAMTIGSFQFIPRDYKVIIASNEAFIKQSAQVSPITINPKSSNSHTSSDKKSTNAITSQQPALLHNFSNVTDLSPELYPWCFESVRFVVEKGIMFLEENNKFYPNQAVRTDEFDMYLSGIINKESKSSIANNFITRIEAAVKIAESSALPLPAL